jgi:hypothetical protein
MLTMKEFKNCFAMVKDIVEKLDIDTKSYDAEIDIDNLDGSILFGLINSKRNWTYNIRFHKDGSVYIAKRMLKPESEKNTLKFYSIIDSSGQWWEFDEDKNDWKIC